MKMKIKPEHLALLKANIKDTEELRAAYREGRIPNAAMVQNKDMRYRWDLMWAIPVDVRRPLVNAMYEYANDDHIDTALRSLVPPLEPAP